MNTHAHRLVNAAKVAISVENELKLTEYISKLSRRIALDGKATTTWGHDTPITPSMARNIIRRLRQLGFVVFLSIRKGYQFEDNYVTDILIILP